MHISVLIVRKHKFGKEESNVSTNISFLEQNITLMLKLSNEENYLPSFTGIKCGIS